MAMKQISIVGWFTVSQAAKEIGVSRQFIHELINLEKIAWKPYGLGNRPRKLISKREIERLRRAYVMPAN